jgi:hypothetical protein
MKNALTKLYSTADERERSVAIILTVLGTLAFLSFVIAGIVGEREKSVSSAGAPAAVSHAG